MWRRRTGLGRTFLGAPKEGGAALTEMALLLPILLLLVIGIFELGGAFKDYLTTSNAVREGTRILSATGTQPTSDCVAVVRAVEAMAIATNLDQLALVEIFEADDDGDPIDSTINEYQYSSGDPAVCTSTAPNCGSYDCVIRQLPTTRTAFVGSGVSPALIGMRITFNHDWYTGFPPFRGTLNIQEKTISRLEPEGFA